MAHEPANPSARARPRDRSVDRYLHALLLLTNHGRQADTGELAEHVGVTPAAASRMVKNLARKKLVRLEPYQGAELTVEGMHRALRIVRRHRLLELFLHKVMAFDLRESHRRALLMQPTIDEVFEEKLDVMLGRPKVDPHGRPIPGKNVRWPALADSALIELPAGEQGRISRLTSEDAEAIRYLHGQGLRAGTTLVVESLAPFDGPMTVRIGRRTVHLGRRLADIVRVEGHGPSKQPSPDKERRGRGPVRSKR
jgi:DtxR family Mn-dependent transcriptional regulator